jgi:hypothetical protein
VSYIYDSFLNDFCQGNNMRKLLIAFFIFISAFTFAQTNIDYNKLWSNNLANLTPLMQSVDKEYKVVITATETDLTIAVYKSLEYFTKYDNISISSVIYKYLYNYNSFKTLKTIHIITYPYIRDIAIADFKKNILADKKGFVVGDFIDASKVQNQIQATQ